MNESRKAGALSANNTGAGNMSEELLTVTELADHLKVPVSWIYQHTRSRAHDRLPYLKIGKYLRFEWNAVRSWLDRQRADPNVSSKTSHAR